MRDCKLYDYQRHCWTDFDRRITAYAAAAALLPRVDSSDKAAAARSAQPLAA